MYHPSMADKQAFLEKLKAVHEFPGPYTFKIIGDNVPELLHAVMAAVNARLPKANPEFSTRTSSGGRHQSITLILEVPDAEAVSVLYEEFHGLKGVRMLL